MAKKIENVQVGQGNLEQKEIHMEEVAFKHGIGEADVQLKATDTAPFHKPGTEFKAHKSVAERMISNGWAVAVCVALFLISNFALGQASVYIPLYNSTNTHTLAKLLAATATRDTVTNTGTGVLGTKKIGGPGTVTIVVTATKVSGTVGGTLTLSGSMDGTTYKPLNTPETQTALATITATDATNTYHWRLNASPFIYYRVSWVGTGTMVAYMDAVILKH